MEKNQIIELYIDDMSSEGSGIGRTDGQVVFVEGCVTGDRVRARITKAKKNYALADCLEITEPSAFRNDGFCQFSGDCGGCPLGDLKYEKQLEMKETWVREKLIRLGGLEEPLIRPIIGMEEPLRYRNKAVFAVSDNGDIGFVKKKSHQVVDCQDCRIQTEACMGVADALWQYLHAKNLRKAISNLMVRTAPGTGEMMAVIKASRNDLPDLELLAGMMDEGSGFNLESIYINDRCIAGHKTITDIADGLKFEISPESFYQVNSEQMVKLYDKAMDYAGLKGGETVLDLYCGVGTIGIFAAKRMNDSGRVIGIESVKPAVIDANRNSVINGLVSTRYIAGKAEEVLPGIMGIKPFMGYNEVNELVEKEPPLKVDHADVVFLDPPRAGCEEDLLDAVIQAAPDRIVYVSCDPATLARDIKY
ncbi:MAG: 23S rRNA (uracil(1939)-C(5))-methyltransferase RlmD, partial [Firmicutes bacterium]|nr:23S rRNA (uracil(1939)-C(5))-methyltransferase RlmD [Bacillota bacterium]